MIEYKLVETFTNTFHVKLKLFKASVGEVLKFNTVQRLINCYEIILHSGNYCAWLHCKEDKFVRDYAHFLEGERLNFGPWEPLNDIALSIFFCIFDCFCYQINHKLIINIVILLLAL